MNNVNITKVYLLDVPLENDYKNTLYFASASAQQTYFSSRVRFTFTDFSYHRKDHFIRVPRQYDDIYKCNYVMYQNSAYSNKWFYAFITDIKYVDDGRTDVYIETDVIQTWLFDYTVKSSFVEREHVSDDTIGLHTVPENLELGEPIQVETPAELFMEGSLCYICVATTEFPDGMPQVDNTRTYNGVYSGLYYLIFSNATYVSNFLYVMDKSAKAEAITSIFLIPRRYQVGSTWYHGTPVDPSLSSYDYEYALLENTNSETVLINEVSFTPVNKLANNYIPRNNKLLTHPYRYFYLTNNVGSDVIFRYEDFNNNLPKFKIVGSISPGCSIKCVPLSYKNVNDTVNSMYSFNYGVVGGKYPICSWKSDTYTNWLTQNGVNIGLNLLASGASLVAGVATGNPVAVGGGVMGIGNTLAQVYQHSLIPDQAKGNTNSSDVTYSSKMLEFVAYKMSIRQEYAQIIDRYFDVFGYKVNMVKVPNTNHRQNYWYTKCIDVNINGDVPQNDMRKIKDCYNKGITFWRNASNIEDYSVSNDIVV